MNSAEEKNRFPWLDLVVVSFLMLFFELACIRFFTANIRMLGFFTNFVLIACFMGMSVGCMTTRKKFNFLYVIPVLFLILCAILFHLYLFVHFDDAIQKDSIYFGAEIKIPAEKRVPLTFMLSFMFAAIGLLFLGIGQTMGRLLEKFEPLKAYTLNIAGSLLGIVIFSFMSYFSIPPVYWFIISFGIIIYLIRKEKAAFIGLFVLFSIGSVFYVHQLSKQNIWSPYYKITLFKSGVGTGIAVNDTSHQIMLPYNHRNPYSLPYNLFNKEKPLDNVLITGAGSGNDVSFALRHGAKSVDAVEIDPKILWLGKNMHPERPYSDSRVNIINTDGRLHLKNTDKKYDLIIYGVVDSLSLFSNYSSIRLENYLFTRECLQEIKDRLKPGGVFVSYNYFRKNWLIMRLQQTMKEVFGGDPLVIFLTPKGQEIKEITDPDRDNNMFVAFINGPGVAQYIPSIPPEGLPSVYDTNIFNAKITATEKYAVPTDDWPFLYVKNRTIPAHNIQGVLIILGISLLFMLIFGGFNVKNVRRHFFFLGAGFMILETVSVTRFALLFGSTWFTNSIVFFSVLTMILLANLLVIKFPQIPTGKVFAGLVLSLVLVLIVPFKWFLIPNFFLRLIAAGLFYFLPIFFAAILFSVYFRQSTDTAVDFGSNTLGAVFGGVSEYLSLIFGYHYLIIFALGFYLLSYKKDK